MKPQYIIDNAIRDKEGKPYGEGYNHTKTGRCYNRYMSNEGWNNFLTEISEEHRKQYEDGDGGELKEGKYPPKMACYGSSSRIIYTLLKGVYGIKFEHPLKTYVGGRSANLDVYLRVDNTDILVEAKCREIYAKHYKVKSSREYCKVYEHIRNKHDNFSFDKEDVNDNNGNVDRRVYNYSFFYNNKPIVRFDIKQLMSHFLGIAAGVLELRVKDNIRFVYFIYNPKELQNMDLETIYEETINEIESINIVELFKSIFEYQKKNLKIEMGIPNFEFIVVSQDDILQHF